MSLQQNIAVVIVTYNRLNILKDCIISIKNQSLKPDGIIVINNGSTDGTAEWLTTQSDLNFVNKNNDGSSGAYYAGIKKAMDEKFSYIWLMDDDGIADINALLELNKAKDIVKNFSFLCSKIISADGTVMNVPAIDTSLSKYNYQVWGQYAEFAITAIQTATYISLFINTQNLYIAGLPCRDFYFWADDIDFTTRLYKTGPAFMAGKSIVKHLRTNPKTPSILTETHERRIQLHFYNIRNTVYLSKRDNTKFVFLKTLIVHIQNMFKSLSSPAGPKKFWIYLKAIWAGLFFKPSASPYIPEK